MELLKKMRKLVGNPFLIVSYFGNKGFLKWLPSKIYLKAYYRSQTYRKVNFKNPVRFTEKIQWLKVFWYDSFATKCADKYEVRNIVKENIGVEYLNELYGVYDSIDEIELDKLPKSFVLKATHSSGQNYVCKDKNNTDWDKQLKNCESWLETNYFWKNREWVYKNIKPRIICEKFLQENKTSSLTDYKIYCFNGVPMYCQVINDRADGGTIDFFDTEWNHMEFTGLQEMPHAYKEIKKPEKYDEMLEISKVLSKDFPFVRVDFFYVNKKIYFGELTFFPRSGFGEFRPLEWDQSIGELLELPSKQKK